MITDLCPRDGDHQLRRTVVSDDLGDLARLFEPSVAACVALRPAAAAWAAALRCTFEPTMRTTVRLTTHDLDGRWMFGDSEERRRVAP